jgi:hypothetical protein
MQGDLSLVKKKGTGKKKNQKEGDGEKRIIKKGTAKRDCKKGLQKAKMSLRGRGCSKHTGKHSNTSSPSALASKSRAADTDYWREMRYAGPPRETVTCLCLAMMHMNDTSADKNRSALRIERRKNSGEILHHRTPVEELLQTPAAASDVL